MHFNADRPKHQLKHTHVMPQQHSSFDFSTKQALQLLPACCLHMQQFLSAPVSATSNSKIQQEL
jgi:hypothetical protein